MKKETSRLCGHFTRHDMRPTEGGWKQCVRCETLSSRSVPLKVRFYSHTKRIDNCLIWTGSILKQVGPTRYPYGYFGMIIDGKQHCMRAHRVAWFLEYGRWPRNDLDHTCQNKSCVELKHLEDVPHIVNIRRKPTYGQCTAGHPWVPGSHRIDQSKGRIYRRCLVCKKAKQRSHLLIQR